MSNILLQNTNVSPRIRIYDLGNLDVYFGQTISITAAQFNASPDAQAYVQRGLLTVVSAGSPTTPVVQVSDVSQITFNIRPGAVSFQKLDANLQNMIEVASSYFWGKDPHFQISGGNTTFSSGTLIFGNVEYALTGGSIVNPGADAYLVAVLSGSTMTVKYQTIPYTQPVGELLVGVFEVVGPHLFIPRGISAEAENVAVDPTGLNAITGLNAQADFALLDSLLTGFTKWPVNFFIQTNDAPITLTTQGTLSSRPINLSASGAMSLVCGLGGSGNFQVIAAGTLTLASTAGQSIHGIGANLIVRNVGTNFIDDASGDLLLSFHKDAIASPNEVVMDFSAANASVNKLHVIGNNGMTFDLGSATMSPVFEFISAGGAFQFKGGAPIVIYGPGPAHVVFGAITPNNIIGPGAALQFEAASGTDVQFIPGTGNKILNSGPTVDHTIAITDLAGGGPIGLATDTVDQCSSFTLNQTTAGQTVTLPSPTDATAGRRADLLNIGTTPITLYGKTVTNGFGASLRWNGSAWMLTGVGG